MFQSLVLSEVLDVNKLRCTCEGECFGRRSDGICLVLSEAMNPCSFQKKEADVTHGVRYDFRPRTTTGNKALIKKMIEEYDSRCRS